MKIAPCLLLLLAASCANPPPTPPPLSLISPERLLAQATPPSGERPLLYHGSDASYSYFSLGTTENPPQQVKIPRHQLVIHSGLDGQDLNWQSGRLVRLEQHEQHEQLHLWAIPDPQRKPNRLDRFLDQSLPAAIQSATPPAHPADSQEKSQNP